MEVRLEISENKKQLQLALEGDFDAVEFERVCAIVIGNPQLFEVTHALVDLRELDGRPSLSQTVLLLERYTKVLRRLKMAILEVEAQSNFYTLLQILATNRGFKIRAFESLAQARYWLPFIDSHADKTVDGGSSTS